MGTVQRGIPVTATVPPRRCPAQHGKGADITGWKGRRIRRVARTLRRNIDQCPCPPGADCPALDEVRLVEAIEQALCGWFDDPAKVAGAVGTITRAMSQAAPHSTGRVPQSSEYEPGKDMEL